MNFQCWEFSLRGAAILSFSFFSSVMAPISLAHAETHCSYTRADGTIVAGRCSDTQPTAVLAKPNEINLDGNIRRETLSTPLGTVQLRWPRKVEVLFGRTPLRAVTEAATVVSKTLKQASFPPEMQRLQINWDVVFMDENMPNSQVPMQLITNCHPGWMTPPGNVYIVADRVAAGCGGRRASLGEADATLAEVLVHEMGHAVEYQLLGSAFGGDRIRAEGFATWFEQYAAKKSSLLHSADILRKQLKAAKVSLQTSAEMPKVPRTAEDYARASLYFHVIEKKLGIRGILDAYGLMRSGMPLPDAAAKMIGAHNQDELNKEMSKLLS